MKKILGLVGSQRRLGNGEMLIKEAARNCGQEYKLELIRLTDLTIEPCKGCYACLGSNKLCPISDDLYFLADKLKDADAVIIAAPCYALGPAAIVKLVGDRIIAMAQHLDDFCGKPCLVIGTAGIAGWEGYTLAALTASVNFLGLEVKDSHLFIGALPGEALEQVSARTRIAEMGNSLFGERKEPSAGQCPTCRSDIWKFPSPHTAVCPLCGQQAILSGEGTSIYWRFNDPGRRFEQQQLRVHFQVWLKEMLQEFQLRRRELAQIRNSYKNEDNWLQPFRN